MLIDVDEIAERNGKLNPTLIAEWIDLKGIVQSSN
jgi:hypothetical protein